MKILLVEDDERSLRLMRMIVNSQGVELLEAADGKTGIRLADDNQIDLFLLDIQLPDMNGKEIVSVLRLQDRYKTTPFIAITAAAMPGDVDDILAAGFAFCFTKPIETKEVCRVIQEYKTRVETDGQKFNQKVKRLGNGWK
ncbi:MAG: response regulator [bacterium]